MANVQPKGEPRLIQSGVAVEAVKYPAIVQSLDLQAGTIVLRLPGATAASTYKVAAQALNLNEVRPGDVVHARVTQELDVYVLRDGELRGPTGAVEKIEADARVLVVEPVVDPSYRLLRLQYPDGQVEIVKVPLGTKVEQMETGDSVVIRPLAVLALKRKG